MNQISTISEDLGRTSSFCDRFNPFAAVKKDLRQAFALLPEDTKHEKVKNDYIAIYNNVAVCAALLGGFALSLMVSPIDIEDDIKDLTIWKGDWNDGLETYYLTLSITAVLGMVLLLICVVQAIQLGQAPDIIIEDYFIQNAMLFGLPFGLFAVVTGGLAIFSLLLASLILKTSFFIVLAITWVLGVGVGVYNFMATLASRQKLCTARIKIELEKQILTLSNEQKQGDQDCDSPSNTEWQYGASSPQYGS